MALRVVRRRRPGGRVRRAPLVHVALPDRRDQPRRAGGMARLSLRQPGAKLEGSPATHPLHSRSRAGGGRMGMTMTTEQIRAALADLLRLRLIEKVRDPDGAERYSLVEMVNHHREVRRTGQIRTALADLLRLRLIEEVRDPEGTECYSLAEMVNHHGEVRRTEQIHGGVRRPCAV